MRVARRDPRIVGTQIVNDIKALAEVGLCVHVDFRRANDLRAVWQITDVQVADLQRQLPLHRQVEESGGRREGAVDQGLIDAVIRDHQKPGVSAGLFDRASQVGACSGVAGQVWPDIQQGDAARRVGGARICRVGGARICRVGGARICRVGGARICRVGGARICRVGGARICRVGGARICRVGGARICRVGGARSGEGITHGQASRLVRRTVAQQRRVAHRHRSMRSNGRGIRHAKTDSRRAETNHDGHDAYRRGRRFGRMRAGLAAERKPRQPCAADRSGPGSWHREHPRRHSRHLCAPGDDQSGVFLAETAGFPRFPRAYSGCRAEAVFLLSRQIDGRGFVDQRPGRVARRARRLRRVGRGGRQRLGLELGAAVFPQAGNRSRLHRPISRRHRPDHRAAHPARAMGRVHQRGGAKLGGSGARFRSRHERRIPGRLCPAADLERRHRAPVHREWPSQRRMSGRGQICG